jgi:UDP-N-acetylglucosamine acyltransferase
MGNRARLVGLNIIGLQRRGFSREDIQALRTAYEMLFVEDIGTLAERAAEVATRFPEVKPVRDIIDFIRSDNSRGFVLQAKAGNGG